MFENRLTCCDVTVYSCAASRPIWASCDRLSTVIWSAVSWSLPTTLRHKSTPPKAIRYYQPTISVSPPAN